MKNELNLSLIEGNLTRDPDLFYTKNGHGVCKFDIAVNFNYKSGDNDIKEVSYITVNTWNKVADACAQYLKKGSKVRVRGRIKQDSWKTKEGESRKKLYIEAASVDFLYSPKKKEETEKVA